MTSAAATAAATGRELLTKLVTPGSTLNSNFTGPLFPEMLKHCKAREQPADGRCSVQPAARAALHGGSGRLPILLRSNP